MRVKLILNCPRAHAITYTNGKFQVIFFEKLLKQTFNKKHLPLNKNVYLRMPTLSSNEFN